MIKLICFDLDGTLLTDDKKILEENVLAIENAKSAGIEIVICTGRQNIAARKFDELIGPNNYMICNNGAEILNLESGKDIFSWPIDKESAKELYSWIISDENVVGFKFDTKNARYVNKIKSDLDYRMEFDKTDENFFENNNILQMTVIFNDEEKMEKTIEKVSLLKDVKIEYKFQLKDKDLGEEHFYLNIVNSKISKGNGIKKLAEFLNINLEDVACFGDDINDLSMFSVAGYGVAMGNSIERLKENANEVIRTNNEPGIAEVLNRFVQEIE